MLRESRKPKKMHFNVKGRWNALFIPKGIGNLFLIKCVIFFFCRGSFLVIITCQSPFSDRTSTLILIKIGI